MIPGGSKNNLNYVEEVTSFDSSISQTQRLILADAQTSGGLIIAVPAVMLYNYLSRRMNTALTIAENHARALRGVLRGVTS